MRRIFKRRSNLRIVGLNSDTGRERAVISVRATSRSQKTAKRRELNRKTFDLTSGQKERDANLLIAIGIPIALALGLLAYLTQ